MTCLSSLLESRESRHQELVGRAYGSSLATRLRTLVPRLLGGRVLALLQHAIGGREIIKGCCSASQDISQMGMRTNHSCVAGHGRARCTYGPCLATYGTVLHGIALSSLLHCLKNTGITPIKPIISRLNSLVSTECGMSLVGLDLDLETVGNLYVCPLTT